MLITSRDRLEPCAGEHVYALRFTLPANRDVTRDEALIDHIDSFVRLYLTRFDSRAMRASRAAPLRWMLVSRAQTMGEIEKARAELEATLFGTGKGDGAGRAVLMEVPVEDEQEAYVPAVALNESLTNTPASPVEAVAPETESQVLTLADELAAFRADMKDIAGSLQGNDVTGALDSFRADLDALAGRLESGISEAAGRVEGAAERLDLITSRLPDADRLELALTRNDASAAMIANGLQESLKLLLKAVEGLERQSPQPKLLDALGREAA